MRTHRPHKKSRNGCFNCKSRRVKCDESSPICSPCNRRGMQCIYPEAMCRRAKRSSTTSAGTTVKKQDTRRICFPRSQSAEILSYHTRLPMANPDITSAMLLSEYMQRTCTSLAGSDRTDPRSKVLMEAIPSLALRHASVSHAIFAVSTLSMAIHDTHCGPSFSGSASRRRSITKEVWPATYMPRACGHYGQSLQALSASLSDLTNDDNINAVIACAILHTPYELAQLRISRKSRRGSDTSSYVQTDHKNLLDLTWMTYIRGLTSLMSSIRARESWDQSMMRPYFSWVDRGEFPRFSSPKNLHDAETIPFTIRHIIMEEGQLAITNLRVAIQEWNDSLSISSSDEPRASWKICILALKSLEEVVERLVASVPDHLTQDLFRILMLWVAQVDKAFLVLLSEEHRLALAIHAHFLVFLILFENVWYIGDLGLASLRDILTTLKNQGNCSARVKDTEVLDGRLFSWPARILDQCDR